MSGSQEYNIRVYSVSFSGTVRFKVGNFRNLPVKMRHICTETTIMVAVIGLSRNPMTFFPMPMNTEPIFAQKPISDGRSTANELNLKSLTRKFRCLLIRVANLRPTDIGETENDGSMGTYSAKEARRERSDRALFGFKFATLMLILKFQLHKQKFAFSLQNAVIFLGLVIIIPKLLTSRVIVTLWHVYIMLCIEKFWQLFP